MKTIKNINKRFIIYLIFSLSFAFTGYLQPQLRVDSGAYLVNSGTVIFNDLDIINNGTINSSGSTFIFTGASNSNIGGTGNYTINNITINKTTDTVGVILNCNLAVNGTLLLTSGDFDVYNKILTLGSSATISGESNLNWIKSSASSNKGIITTTRDLTGGISGYTFGNIGIAITTTSTLGNTVVTRRFEPITIAAFTGVSKSFTVSPTNNTGLNATFIFYYFGNELTVDHDPLHMLLYQSTDNGLTFQEVNSINNWNSGNQSGSLTDTALSSFGANNIWTSSDEDSPLPIVLESFTSSVSGREVTLNWITSEEHNNAGFELQRMSIGISDSVWKTNAFIKGNGTKNTKTTYIFKDSRMNSGKYKYRIKQIDFNGNFEYYELGNIVEVALPKTFSLSQNYPNPFNPTTKIDFEVPHNSIVRIIIYDILGREIKTLVNKELSPGYYSLLFDGSGLASGVYFYRMNAGDFVKVKKMVVIK